MTLVGGGGLEGGEQAIEKRTDKRRGGRAWSEGRIVAKGYSREMGPVPNSSRDARNDKVEERYERC